jgi:hypothetical protein
MARQLLIFFIEYPVVLSTLLVVLFGAVRMSVVPNDRKRNDWFLAAATLAWPASAICQLAAERASAVRPLKYDLYIYQLDGVLGFQPSFALGQIAARHLWLMILLHVSYGILPMVILAAFAAYLWRRSECEAVEMVRVFGLNLVAALPIYLIIPVCGPQFAFPGFPNPVAQVIAHPILLSAAPNGIPSVHTSSALLVAWYLRHWGIGRLIGALYLALMVGATLASGQHYLFDLFTALPYAAGVYWIAGPRITRRKALVETGRTVCVSSPR